MRGGVLDLTAPGSKTRRGRVQEGGEVSPTLDTGCNVGVAVQIGQLYGTEVEPNPQAGRVFSADGISPTLDSMGGGNRQPKIAVTEDGEESLTTQDEQRELIVDSKNVRIRKLTPKECFRLQGFPDELFEKAAQFNSDSQLYKQAGNSATINVIYDIARRL